jgi:mRNA interferase MazF
MKDIHPFLVLSPAAFNERTSLVIGCPMTTAEYNQSNPFAVAECVVQKSGKAVVSYVLCHQPKSFDWRARKAKAHPMGRLSDGAFKQACAILNDIIALAG